MSFVIFSNIHDVFIPTPGVTFAGVEPIEQLYQPYLEKWGLSLSHFHIEPLGISKEGVFRKFIQIPRDLKYRAMITKKNYKTSRISFVHLVLLFFSLF